MSIGWQPEQPLRNQIIHYFIQSFPYIILTTPTQQPFTGATRHKNKAVLAAEKKHFPLANT